MYRKALLGFASSVAIVSAASAAEMYTPAATSYKDAPIAAYNWTGIYAGFQGGGQ